MRGLINSPHPTPYIIFLYYFLIKLIIKTKDIVMANKKINVVIERGVDGTYSAFIADNNCEFGCIGEGKSVEETKSDFLEAVDEMKKVYDMNGKKFPDVEFNFIYDVASFLNYYAYAFSLAGLARITGVNQGQLSHYVTGRRKPSKTTVEKIEKSLHAFANEIGEIKFG